MAKKKNCRKVTFRKGRSGRRLAKPVTVTLCDRGPGKPAKRKAGKAGARAVCRKGSKAGKKGMARFRAMQFVSCR